MSKDIEKNIIAPTHYQNEGGYQVFDILTAWDFRTYYKDGHPALLTNIQLIGSAFNVVKYLLRAGKKDNVAQEFGKIVVYLQEIKKFLSGTKFGNVGYRIYTRKYTVAKISKDYKLSKEDAKILETFVNGDIEVSIIIAKDKYNKLKKAL